MTDPRDAELSRLSAEVDRIYKMRDEDDAYHNRQHQDFRLRIARLHQELASAKASHEMQTKATLAFREDWLREKARADALEASINVP